MMRESLRAFRTMVWISFQADPARSVGALVCAAGQLVAPPLRIIGLKELADGLLAHDRGVALHGVVVILVFTAVNRFMAWASLNVRFRLRERTQLWLDGHLMQLMTGIPGIEHHERPDYLDRVEQVRVERHYLANPFNSISWSAAALLQAGTTVVLLAGVHPALALLPLFALPGGWATMRSEDAMARAFEARSEDSRRLRHLFDLTTSPAAAKELRIFGLSEELLRRRRRLFDHVHGDQVRAGARATVAASAAWALFGVAYAAAVGFAIHLANTGRVSIGSVVLVLGLGSQLNVTLSELVEFLAWFARTNRAVRRLDWLAGYSERAHAALAPAGEVAAPVPDRLRQGIGLHGVSFTYPGTTTAVLDGVDLWLPAGSTVAIVGENGAGKTTLVKLLSRFYEPTAGTITVDGTDLRRFDVAGWRARTSAGFQDFARLQLVARESVGVGDVERMGSDPAVARALQRAAASDLHEALPHGLATRLGRTFPGGVELSLGQWQKVALARASMREAPLLLVLDEPTASLDAPTEHALFEHFAGAAAEVARRAGAVTILVSHRFSTVRMADLILVVAGGRIVERGDHDALVAAGGLYAELYGLQARAYR